jgi:hypothetical protein
MQAGKRARGNWDDQEDTGLRPKVLLAWLDAEAPGRLARDGYLAFSKSADKGAGVAVDGPFEGRTTRADVPRRPVRVRNDRCTVKGWTVGAAVNACGKSHLGSGWNMCRKGGP